MFPPRIRVMLAATLWALSADITFAALSATDELDLAGQPTIPCAIASQQGDAIAARLEFTPLADPLAQMRSERLRAACATADAKIIAAALDGMPPDLEWTEWTLRALRDALSHNDSELARLLLSKHPAPPTLEGRNVPLLAQAIVENDLEMCRALFAAGANPNIALSLPSDKEFVAALPVEMRAYVKGDEGITPLMIAAGMGKPEFIRVLLDAGADRNRMTKRYKMLALYFAVQTETYDAVQLLLGCGPTPNELRIEISLKKQRVSVIKNGSSVFQTQCSTGRDGFTTPAGHYVITDKKRDHVSSIYKAQMPFFMRLNCRDFGMHAGVVPNRPASHGCIRLPAAAAKKLFAEIPIGTVVMID